MFRPRPSRLLEVVPYLAVIVALSVLAARPDIHWALRLLAAVLLGNVYVGFFFFGHDIVHGAMGRPGPVHRVVLLLACAVTGASPHLFRVWHVEVHHRHTNHPTLDPDRRPDISEHRDDADAWIQARFQPGSGHPLSWIFPIVAFALHLQRLALTPGVPGFERLNRRRAIAESGVLVAGWIGLAFLVGWPAAVFVVLTPVVVANTVITSYIMTNHMLRPHAAENDTLTTTMSVRVSPFTDLLHRNFSHHVEHHLFPNLSAWHLPKVRRVLRDEVPDDYLAPGFGWAFVRVFRTPPFVDGDRFVNPVTRRELPMEAVEAEIRAHTR